MLERLVPYKGGLTLSYRKFHLGSVVNSQISQILDHYFAIKEFLRSDPDDHWFAAPITED